MWYNIALDSVMLREEKVIAFCRDQAVHCKGQLTKNIMLPGNDETESTIQETGQFGRRLKPFRCSICTRFNLFDPISHTEPVDAPEPRFEWILCKSCDEALLNELSRSTIRSSLRLRIAMGLVAAERSPNAYPVHSKAHEQLEFEREFAWFVWAIVLFGLLHVAIFAILLALPR